MMFIDEMRKGWDVLRLKGMDVSKDMKETLLFYYKATFIPFIILFIGFLIFAVIIGSVITRNTAAVRCQPRVA